ncbi:heterokaryon incompatibility protein-domain-containing protein [Aspergillus pseudonomiae]|nr:heterokaryon incompatibility protein-domain-containing protein [Aspergillus pseudonomiae]
MAAFTYSKLPPGTDMTRMLRLFPHKDSNAQIRGELIEYELSNTDGRKHIYEALSYVWYDGEESRDKEPRSIILNDCIFPVTRNLFAALVHLRNHQLDRVLWIDAVCINQSDNDEKERQIPFMRTIYAQANCVIVWLGEARDNSDEAFERIRFLAEDGLKHQSFSDGGMTDDSSDEVFSTDSDEFLADVSTVQNTTIEDCACSMLLQRNWFRRIWVLQEVGVARCISIMCGHAEMNGYTFCEGFRRLEVSSNIMSHVHPVIHIMRDAIFRPKYRPAWRGALSMGELIDLYRNHNATMQHDKVYALLGLCADDPKVPALKPNYSLPWDDFLKQVTTYILGGECSVQTWPDRDIAVVKGKGWILGYINRVEARAPRDDRANFKVEFDHTASSVSHPFYGTSQWILRDPRKLIQKGDVVFLLPDHFEVVMTAITPENIDKASFDLQLQEWHSIGGFLHDILLTWRISRAGSDDYIGLQKFQECPYQAKIRLHNMASAVKKVAYIILQRNLDATSSGPIFEHMLVQCAGNFPFCEDVVKAAAGSGGRTSLELLLQHGGENLPITEDVVKAAAANILSGYTYQYPTVSSGQPFSIVHLETCGFSYNTDEIANP